MTRFAAPALLALTLLAGSAAAEAPKRATPAAAKPTPAKADTVFSRWIEDLPVMPRLTETDGGYSFEIAQGGRLAEVRLHGVVEAQVVRSFYASTLPALGWKAEPSEPYAYRRGRERLILHVGKAKPLGVMAVFVLTPVGPTPPTPAA